MDSVTNSLVETRAVGEGTEIGAFCHIRATVRLGARCRIGSHVFLDDGVTVGDDAIIGAGTIVAANVAISEMARIAPGSVVTLDVPPHAVVTGNPARIVGYEDVPPLTAVTWKEANSRSLEIHRTGVRGVTLHKLPYVEDLRGYLSFGEVGQHLPFIVKRYFVVFDVASKEIRGEHAHRELEQFLVCVNGSCNIIADDGVHREEFELDRPNLGVYIPAMVWSVQHKYSRDGVLMVLASDIYRSEDYIRDYNEFKTLVARA